MRRDWVGSFSRRVGGYERIGRGFDWHSRGVADIRAHEYAHVISHANGFGDT